MNAEIKARILGEAITLADELLESSNLDEEMKNNLEKWLFSHIPVTTIEGYEPELNREMFIELINDAIENRQGNPMIKSGTKQTGEVVIRDRFGNIKYQERCEMEVVNGNCN